MKTSILKHAATAAQLQVMVMRISIADHAVAVLKETDNPAVMYGDCGLLDMIGQRAGMKPMHPLNRWKLVLAGLERAPDKFDKSYVRTCNGLVRCFTMKVDT